MTTLTRSKDAHEKIQLGGLVVKAGLRGENKAFILGLLVFGYAERDNMGFRERMVALGQEAFDT